MNKLIRALAVTAAVTALSPSVFAQSKYDGPRPEKPDLPYLLHARTLLESEPGDAQMTKEKNSTVYTVAGATSKARTPVPEPIFILRAERLKADRLSLYRMTVEKGNRVIRFPERQGKNSPKPVFMMVTNLDRGLFRVEVNEPIGEGEFCLTPDGENTVFCFTTY